MKRLQFLENFKKVRFIVFAIILFSSCTEKNLSIVLDDKSSTLVYSDSIKMNRYVKLYLEELNKGKENNKYVAWQCNSSKIIFSEDFYNIDSTNICELKDGDYEIFKYAEVKYPFQLSCEKTVEINNNGIIFIFCYNDVLNFMKTIIKNNESTPIVHYYSRVLNIISKQGKAKEDKINGGDILVSSLLNNLSFSMKLEKDNKQLKKIEIINISTGYSNIVEYYIYDDKNKIVAYLDF